ncbi:MAG: sigma-70 family RNA polymerase sigma factor [Clostridia bacterium]|nr:sigma-70 family RNA polymerase sigma factor [Clostridia bacterium]
MFNNINEADAELVSLFTTRKEKAISELEQRYGRYIYGIASNFLSDADDINDCVNDTYLAVWDQIPPDKPVNLKGYVARIVKNISISRYREKKRQKRIVSNYSVSFEECSDDIKSNSTVEDEYDGIRLKKLINCFTKGLPDRQRFIFISKYYYCDTSSFIAKSLGISVTTVSNELSDIRDKLKDELLKEGFDYE